MISTTKATDLSVLSQCTQPIPLLNSTRGNETLFSGEQRLGLQSKTSSSTITSSKFTHRIVDANDFSNQQNNRNMPVKEKYQIRSIVEIYGNPGNDSRLTEIGKVKRNTTIEETQKYDTSFRKIDDNDDLMTAGKERNEIITLMTVARFELAPLLTGSKIAHQREI
jgi:hypothetical protein